jgi:large repetitive protein
MPVRPTRAFAVVVAVTMLVTGFGGVAQATRPTRPLLSIQSAGIAEGDSGTTALLFTVTASVAPTRKQTTVSYVTANGSAIAPGDYTATTSPQQLTFAIGETTKIISIPVKGDTLNEANETFFVNLRSPFKAKIANGQAVGTILNDDALPSVSINAASVTEGDSGTTTASFPVSLSAASGRSVTVHFATSDGTATFPGDYTATSGDLTIPPGTTTAAVTVPVVGDTTVEPNETFTVTLSSPINATLGSSSAATGTIVNNDPVGPQTLSINDLPTISEGTGGSPTATFTVTLSSPMPVGSTATVAYSTADGTALAPSDYQATSGVLTFLAGELTKPLTVPIALDSLDEPDETFFVNITTTTPGIGVLDPQGIGTILDNDAPPTVWIAAAQVSEGDSGLTALSFTASLSSPSGFTTSVDYATGAPGTATPGVDYQSVSAATVSFAPGEVTQTIEVQVIGDTTPETDETLTVTLTTPSAHLTAGSPMTALGTIVDDDAPAISIDDVRVQEPASGTTPATFTVTLSDPALGEVLVNYAITNGTATTPADYTAVPSSGTLTFAIGETSKTITVTVLHDSVLEPDETFTVDLTAGSVNAQLLDPQATGTIVDQNAPAVSAGNAVVTESGTAQVPISLSASSTFPVTVDYATADGTAAAPADYTPATGTVTIAPGQTTATVPVSTLGDALVEPTEAFTLVLSNPTNSTIAQATATVTLTDGPLTGGVAGGPSDVLGRLPRVADGYWLAATDGGLFAFGGAGFFGSTGTIKLNQPIVGMAATPSGNGYWLVARDGGVFNFGDATYSGSTGAIKLNQPIVGMTPTPSGNGYWLVARDGGIFAFGDATFLGSTGAVPLNTPIVGMTASPSANGYRLVAEDGGLFAFGDASFLGSTGSIKLNTPIVGLAATPSGNGYWLVARDGGIFAFGDAGFFGSTGAIHLNQPITGMAGRLH